MQITLEGKILSVKLIQQNNKSWLGQIIHMDECLRHTSFYEVQKNHGIFQGVTFVSASYPEIFMNTLYLRGYDRSRDGDVFCVEDEQQFIRAVIDFGANYKCFSKTKILNEINTFLTNKSYRYQIFDTNSLILLKSEYTNSLILLKSE